ncbi:bifunctional glutamate N-acetyltransferase/amino-acid acetyltransferase ArgJ [Gynuella sunshinyii]|uniref:Arginine biosynthesis bifunctional protein ArgJ n=1 Tax=Gynuella sunshinyii YC6258 TaxID=1445510 RepID=A0A0C5VVF3_9GAMM|nr:bifunctional glutamate N-acetyltransferase/amino-acid acetyltransferase ArgJ [Gynuella sunshinyii]AJQ94439.1 N-acetylglutamate synthase (N-acetylornithine aminotransferase) [Gynuella sunshinyii YC6258]
MAVGHETLSQLFPVNGVSIGIACAGIKKPNRRDLVIFDIAPGSQVAGVFTKNKFCAAPVHVAKKHLASGEGIRFLVINTGNANAGTGRQGMEDAIETCTRLAAIRNVGTHQVLPFSTGVIGENLPMDRLLAGLPNAVETLEVDNWEDAAYGIMTTDTRPKAISAQFQYQGEIITVTGIAKGSGMIKPNMATMLGFVATDAPVTQLLLQKILSEANEQSFNRITVDGDTSTNDACILIATGKAAVPCCDSEDSDLYRFLKKTVGEVLLFLAQAIVRDGEGATKFVTVVVNEARNSAEALEVAYTIAHSPLVKTAFSASDANWGRILAAVGRSQIEELDVNRVSIWLDDVRIVHNGQRDDKYTEEQGSKVMAQEEIRITVSLGQGEASERIYTTDLSAEYVRINAEYRT